MNSIILKLFLFICIFGAILSQHQTEAREKLNVLLITVDDMDWQSPGCYGGTVNDITPNMDRLASEGMKFMRAHVTVAVCQPSRQSWLTGKYPHHNGALGFGPISQKTVTLGELLDKNGYMNGVMCKEHHLAPKSKFNWHAIYTSNTMAHGRSPKLFYKKTKEFIGKAKSQKKPWFLMISSEDPHRPLHGSPGHKKWATNYPNIENPSRVYKENEIVVPGFLPDIPEMRTEVARYYSSVKRADDSVGAVLKALKESRQERNTIVILMSDNGMAFVSAKWNTYDQSTRTPLLVRWPGVVKAGSVDEDHFINGTDFMPTILEALNIKAPRDLDGFSYVPVLKGKKQKGRDHVITGHFEAIHYYMNKQKRAAALAKFAERGWSYDDSKKGMTKEIHMRCVRYPDISYVYNEWSDGKDYFYLGGGGTAMMKVAKKNPDIAKRIQHIKHRTPEELFDCNKDPDELNNLVNNPEYKEKLESMRQKLLHWMKKTKDPILKTYKSQIQ
ncbi:MAG: sulfatase [Planctomycetes bacterium]|nr:sulfatase [Planctomycetota bacterium]